MYYTSNHEWVRPEEDAFAVGLSEYAVGKLGDVMFVKLPRLGTVLSKGQILATLEAAKASWEMASPISGTVLSVHAALQQSPSLLSEDCCGEGWIARIEPSDRSELGSLMDEEAYRAYRAELE